MRYFDLFFVELFFFPFRFSSFWFRFVPLDLRQGKIIVLRVSTGTWQLSRYRDAVPQSVERATRGEEVTGFITAVAARSLLVGSVSM